MSKCESGERRIDVIEFEEYAALYRKPMSYFLKAPPAARVSPRKAAARPAGVTSASIARERPAEEYRRAKRPKNPQP